MENEKKERKIEAMNYVISNLFTNCVVIVRNPSLTNANQSTQRIFMALVCCTTCEMVHDPTRMLVHTMSSPVWHQFQKIYIHKSLED